MAENISIGTQPVINFCDSRLGTTVSSDKISTDGYEADNLVSVDFWKKQNGFMSERFIKPPINLTFNFPCPISIWRIVVDPVIGSQKSSSIGIVSTSSGSVASRTDTCINGQSKPNERLQSNAVNKRHISVSVSQNVSLKQTSSERPHGIIGSQEHRNADIFLGKVNMSTPSKICFQDTHFLPPASVSEHQDKNGFHFWEQLRHVRQVYNASHITVRICQTLGGSVGAVKSVEIWGQPTRWCNKELVRRIYDRHKCGVNESFNKPEIIDIPQDSADNSDSKESIDLCTERRKPTTVEIPEEFLDPLSCDLMTIPMLLPSGRNVDKSSLDRFIDIEASWGRHPSDPFTGVAFTTESHPIPNDALKGRIDHFLISNETSINIQTLPRTVATVYQERAAKRKHESDNKSSSYKNDKSQSGALDDHSHTKSSYGGQSSILSTTKRVKLCNPPDGNIVSNFHEKNLHSSLNSALSNVLGNFPSFRKRANSTESSSRVNTCLCSICKINLESVDLKYKLCCKHLLCRDCLLKLKTVMVQCIVCDQVTPKQDIERIHR